MPSPFPGMDPYLEGQVWEDFHARLISAIADALGPGLRPKYVARIERRVYLQHPGGDDLLLIRPDVSVVDKTLVPAAALKGGATAPEPPFEIPLLVPEEEREGYLEIRLRESGELVTVIEVLSPANKRPGGDGWVQYRAKREAVLRSPAHFVEIDLLRGGERIPALRPLPPGDYYAIVSRAERRPVAEVWPASLRDPLPTISVPLAGDDPALPLDLQSVFGTVYDRAGYDYSLDYRRGTVPPLSEEEATWASALLSTRPGPGE